MPEAAGGAGGLLDSLKALARSLLAIGQTRLEIISGEIEEQRVLFLREALLTVIAAFCLGMGIIFGAVFVILIAPAEFRAHVAALFAVFFFVACGALFAVLRAARDGRPKAFAATIQELGKDRDSLQ
ncbi:MAG: hypothetical protein A3G25_15980 [Betaproteobacteria bacterium RIFCSPLOWO2_12_FULL_63_13]|nr:MAG: hypothetical protein A3H32_12445 [Betaproteobacteria bacterium RIFCSPLOWO2_02_FULL_63_19]OGA42973.1 MAG: hypothetical protein A3G25_15980 [Betaproteobacteria bacterium RIFCSPLOWO2_12_FULL_63_13]